jgi:hypothetical protein
MISPCLPAELIQQFQRLSNQLSPENLSCDGELTKYQVDKNRIRLKLQWESLEKQAGRTVSDEEVWMN